MRITAPAPGARARLTDIDLTDPRLFTEGDAHLAWQTLRADQPVCWQRRDDGEGFWAVTRHADVRRVLAEHRTFSSQGGTVLAMLDAPDPAAGIMMHATDPPGHRRLRGCLGPRFAARAMPACAGFVAASVCQAGLACRDADEWDAAEVFRPLPMDVAAHLLGLPEADTGQLLRLSYAALAPHDPRFSAGRPESAAAAAHADILGYFADRVRERRTARSADLISQLLDLRVDGRPLDEYAVLVNCLSLLLGAVVTTSQVICATMIGLAQQQAGEGRWPAGPVAGLVEEGLRWTSPVIHFMRRARHDVNLHGVTIARGDAVTAWIASANRDEAAFERAATIDAGRTPNRHLAFGAGPHLCLGASLARLMLVTAFEYLAATIEVFELAGPPVHLISNEIAGVVSLPVRVRRRARPAAFAGTEPAGGGLSL